MTLPFERTRAIQYTREFLRDLLDPKATPRISKRVRERAYICLRHFPWDSHLDEVSGSSPDVFSKTKRGKND